MRQLLSPWSYLNEIKRISSYVTMHKTWIHHYTPELKTWSAKWLEADSSHIK